MSKYFLLLTFFVSNAFALSLSEGQKFTSIQDEDNCPSFTMHKSANPNTASSWLLGPKIVFFEPGHLSKDQSNCMVEVESFEKDGKWVQTTKTSECEESALLYIRVETLEQNSKGELIYSSEITYQDQKNQVTKLSCRFRK